MKALIDADLVAYRSAASCEPTKAKPYQEPLEIAVLRCDNMMNRILDETGASGYRAFLSGSENFRYSIDPEYKANRRDAPRPEWLQPIREYLVIEWEACISEGIEADDSLGIAQTKDTILCSLDKDLLTIPGKHYNWVKQEFKEIDEHTAWVNFYTQLVMGDKSDNVMGYDGKMRQTVPKFLQPIIEDIERAESPREMFKIVSDIYELGADAMYRNAQLLYIQRKEGDKFVVPE